VITPSDTDPSIYPPEAALEHVVVTGDHPVRLLSVLWPLWEVETEIDATTGEPYDVLDRFIVRTVAEAGISSSAGIAAFLGIDPDLVGRFLHYLRSIGHIVHDPAAGGAAHWDRVELTELGRRSIGDGVRYIRRVHHHPIRVERFTTRLLPRRFHHGTVPVTDTTAWRRRPDAAPVFTALDGGGGGLVPADIEALARRSDREELNLPRELHHLRVVEVRPGYLPLYLIQTAGEGLLTYPPGRIGPEPFFQDVARSEPSLVALIPSDHPRRDRERWSEWLADGPPPRGDLEQLPSGGWRATFPGEVFTDRPRNGQRRLPLHRLGSFELHHDHVIQLWCADIDLRHQALGRRVRSMARAGTIGTGTDLDRHLTALAALLHLQPPTPEAVLAAVGEDDPAAEEGLRRVLTGELPATGADLPIAGNGDSPAG
jgi:hypothetical protein